VQKVCQIKRHYRSGNASVFSYSYVLGVKKDSLFTILKKPARATSSFGNSDPVSNDGRGNSRTGVLVNPKSRVVNVFASVSLNPVADIS